MATEIIVTKSSDEVVNNSATLQDDDELKFAVSANEKWFSRLFLIWTSGTTPDLKVGFTAPSGSTIRWHHGTFTGTPILTESDSLFMNSQGAPFCSWTMSFWWLSEPKRCGILNWPLS